MSATAALVNADPANRLGLDYKAEAAKFAWREPIVDAHLHIRSVEAARMVFAAADAFNVQRFWSQTPVEDIDAINAEFPAPGRVEFVAGPDHLDKDKDRAFTTGWLARLEKYREKGVRVCKFWAAPRGRDIHPALTLDHPIRLEGMKLARRLGMMFMTHVSDPDTWFATKYKDAGKYGTKAQQYEPLVRLLEEFHDVPWLAAHMAGDPEHLDHLQELLDRFPNLYLDTAAAKWMVRELSKTPGEFRAFVTRNRGRVLFGTDIVAAPNDNRFDLYASRYWAMRTLVETDYDGPSPIVDPDLHMVDERVAADATAHLRGAKIEGEVLRDLYSGAAAGLMERAKRLRGG